MAGPAVQERSGHRHTGGHLCMRASAGRASCGQVAGYLADTAATIVRARGLEVPLLTAVVARVRGRAVSGVVTRAATTAACLCCRACSGQVARLAAATAQLRCAAISKDVARLAAVMAKHTAAGQRRATAFGGPRRRALRACVGHVARLVADAAKSWFWACSNNVARLAAVVAYRLVMAINSLVAGLVALPAELRLGAINGPVAGLTTVVTRHGYVVEEDE
eukprot:TRINITY_DN56701_c0_g1_i1.p1 TRINITY_DN56701_c0_g1~~TRINITY_DN56701_c0_g1_i1.p1  ORF type:complete len:221 (+),score=5.35 TRINITY_DN56701_c0_g1_i1:202-864(+)